MKKIQSIALMMAIALTGTVGITSCSSEKIDENVVYDSNGNAGVKSEFVISIPRSVVRTTRMSGDVTQSASTVNQFRGIDNIRLIPFGETPTGFSTKNTDIIELGHIGSKEELGKPGTLNYKVYNDKFVPVGTKHFMFYGKAIDNTAEEAITSMDDKFTYGFLNATGLTETTFSNPNGISFSLEQINPSVSANTNNAIGQKIVELLNTLAQTKTKDTPTDPNDKWSTTTNLSLATLYKNFISLTTASSNSLAIILSRLYFSADRVVANDPARPLANAIRTTISGACKSLTEGSPASLEDIYVGYPSNLGLPDGAARVSWDETTSSFVDVYAQYSATFQQALTDYVYPAALWYYVSTPLKAADSKKSDKYESKDTWGEVIDNVYNDAGDAVAAGTQSIALRDPVQYGVGRVETKIQMLSGKFYDGNGTEVNVENGYTLKGFLLGGQSTVGYNFEKTGDENMPIYDSKVPSGITVTSNVTTSANQTLALQTETNQIVNAALELVNNGADFMGADGIIPAGGTFYLAVRLDPSTASNYKKNELLDKIVIKDHVTKLTVTIKNGMPHVEYVVDDSGNPIGIDTNGDGTPDNEKVDIDGDGTLDEFITDPEKGGPGWDTNGDGVVDIPVGVNPDSPFNPEGLGTATNGIPDLSSPSIELGTSVDLEWLEGLELNPFI